MDSPPLACAEAKDQQEFIRSLMADDAAMVQYANENRLKLLDGFPSQSHFRVYALLFVENADRLLQIVQGSNAEQGYIGGAICAERAALCQLRFIRSPIVRKVVVVTDSKHPLSPGALCREFLMSHVEPDVCVVMGSSEGDEVSQCLMKDLWPYPYVYRKQSRSTLLQEMERMSTVLKCVDSLHMDVAINLYAKALSVNSKDSHDSIHPVRLSAALLFDDSSISTAWQLKGLEYGCTLDPVSQLLLDAERKKYCLPCNNGDIESASRAFVKPTMLVMVDQMGIAHAPFAQARSLLSEHGYGYLQILVHDEFGDIHVCSIADLVPQPKDCPLLSHDDFNR
jgi:cytidine deaminase